VLPHITLGCVNRNFDASYHGIPSWDIGRPQPAFAELAEARAFGGRVLDVGCGTGEHALLAAAMGLPAAGVDVSPTAIEIATRKAAQRNLPVRFTVHDARNLGTLGEQFDTVIDSALFHVFSGEDRVRYVDGLHQMVEPGGRYFMLCFSAPRTSPPGVTRQEIEATFVHGWRIDEIESATVAVWTKPFSFPAWRTAMTRI
jgi:2-polyprenyl-3-methyl-5-hydroxy-6-metoxy-1,4-benzoquinol methylase